MKPTTYNPARDFLIVRPELEPEKSEGGIIIPQQSRQMLNEGEIIRCGPEVSEHLKPGMTVVFTPSSEYKLKMDDGTLTLVVQETNILLWCEIAEAKPKSLFPASESTKSIGPQ